MDITDAASRKKEPFGIPCRRLLPAASAVALLSMQSVHAAEWSVAPSVGLRETYSSNIALAPDATARSEWVTELAPRIALSASGLRFKFNADYALRYLDYHGGGTSSEVQHNVNANASGEFLKDLLFVDAIANVSQQRISAFGPQSIDYVNLTGNRTEVQTYGISPYLRHDIGRFAAAELRYTAEKKKADDPNLLDSDVRRTLFDIGSGNRLRTWGWGFEFDRQRIDYRLAPETELSRYTARLQYEITPRIFLKTTAGYEDNNYLYIGEKPSGKLWSAGLSWLPSQSTSVSASAGHRYFGKTFAASAGHHDGKSAWDLGYDEEVTSQSAISTQSTLDTAAFLDRLWNTSIPDEAARKKIVDTFIHNAGLPTTLSGNIYNLSNRIFLQKSLRISLALDGSRNTAVFAIHGLRREPLSVAPVAGAVPPTSQPGIDDDSLQTGASANWIWHVTPRSDLAFGASYTRARAFGNERIDHFRAFRTALAKQFGRKSSATFELRRQQRSSTQQDAAYTENAVALLILMQL